MKIIKTASGNELKMSKSEWQSIGRTAGWSSDSSLDRMDRDEYRNDPATINNNINEFMLTRQNQDPNQPEFAVDIREKAKSIPANIRGRINTILSKIGRQTWPSFPVDELFNACKTNNIIPIQEDGTEWGGMIGSQGECGHDKAPMRIELAVDRGDGYVPSLNGLIISACTRSNGNLEIVAYIS